MLLFNETTFADYRDATCLSRNPTNNNASLKPCDASDLEQLFTYDTHPINGRTGTDLKGLSGIRFWQDNNCLTEPAPGFSSHPSICDSAASFFRVGIPTEDAFIGKNPITNDQVEFKKMYDEWGYCYFFEPDEKKFKRICTDHKWHIHYLNGAQPILANHAEAINDIEPTKNEKKDDMTIYFIAIPVFIVILLVFFSRYNNY